MSIEDLKFQNYTPDYHRNFKNKQTVYGFTFSLAMQMFVSSKLKSRTKGQTSNKLNYASKC